MSHKRRHIISTGFTLIELLVVIAVIGVLVGALLVVLNPIEQINRAKDAGAKTDAVQLYQAVMSSYSLTATIVTPDGSYGGQQPFVNRGELKTIIKNGNGGPFYWTNANTSWVAAGDFEVDSGTLFSQASLLTAKAQSDASSQNCGSGSTSAEYYTYLSQGGQWHYWCNHP